MQIPIIHGGFGSPGATLKEFMVSKYKFKHTMWVDLESPSRAEIMTTLEEFGLPDALADELGTCTLRSKVDYYDRANFIYLVLHFPVLSDGKANSEQEIDFIVGKNFLITTRYEKIDSFTNFSRLFDKESFIELARMGEHAGFIFTGLMREIYRHSLDQVETINESLKRIEEDIFKGQMTEAVSVISNTNRKYLNFKQALRHHGEIITSFERAALDMFGSGFKHSLEIVSSEHNRLRNTMDVGKEILSDLRETNDSLLTTRTNQTMKTLTAMTFTLLPITLITGIFGMNVTDNMLFIQNGRDFLLVLIFMLLVGLIMFIYFKGKRWL